jgi:phosphoserine phosphatase
MMTSYRLHLHFVHPLSVAEEEALRQRLQPMVLPASWQCKQSALHYTALLVGVMSREALPDLSDFPPVDSIIQPLPEGGIKLAFFDMDSTVIQNECIDEMAMLCGKGEEVSAITKGAMEQGWDFEESLRRRIAILVASQFQEAWLETCYQKITLTAGAETLLSHLKVQGVRCVLVSGGFSFFTQRIAERLGFAVHYSNQLQFQEGILAGVEGCPWFHQKIIGKEAKAEVMRHEVSLAAAQNPAISLAHTLFVGDGGNDALAASIAGLGIAFHATNTSLRRAAQGHINDGDLSLLTELW